MYRDYHPLSVTISLLIIACLIVLGCEGEVSKKHLESQCIIERTNGAIVSVKVRMPSRCRPECAQFTIKNRKDMNALVEAVENLLTDLKATREEMPIIEEPIIRNQK